MTLIDLAGGIQTNRKATRQTLYRLAFYEKIIFHSLRKIFLFHIRSNDYFSFRKIFI